MDVIQETVSQVTDALGQAQRMVELPPGPATSQVLATASTNAAVTTESPTVADTSITPTDGSSDDFLSCSYSIGPQEENIAKMILLMSATWPTSSVKFRIIGEIAVPIAFFSEANMPAFGQARYFRLARTAYHMKMVVNSPAGTSGALMLVYVPPGLTQIAAKMTTATRTTEAAFSNYVQQTVTHLPHVILDVRCSTEVSLTVPFMNFTNYVDYRRTTGTFDRYTSGGSFMVVVLAQLSPPIGNANTVGYSIYGELMDLDFQCPYIPTNPQGRRRLQRRHVPPKPGRALDPKQINIGPGPGSVVAGNSTHTRFADTLAIANERTAIDFRTAGARVAITDLLQMARRWDYISYDPQKWQHNTAPGAEILGFEITFGNTWPTMAFLADKFSYWRGSIEVSAVVYASAFTTGKFQICWFPGDSTARADANQMGNYRNSLFVTGDVSPNSTTLICPFTYHQWRAPTVDSTHTIGRISIRVVNPLRTGAGTANAPDVVVRIRAGKDFRLYAPHYGLYVCKLFNYGLSDDEDGEEEIVKCFVNFDTHPVDIDGASHTDVTTVFGRSWHAMRIEPSQAPTRTSIYVPTAGVGSLLRGFIYWSGEVVFTLINYSTNPSYVAHSYEFQSIDTIAKLTSMGCLIIPPGETKTIVAPFYSDTPLRCLHAASGITVGTPTFGYLYTIVPDGHLEVMLALRSPNIFGLSMIPSSGGTIALAAHEFFDHQDQGPDEVDCHFCEFCEKMKKWSRPTARRFRFCLRLQQLGFELNLEYSSTSQKELTKQGVEPNPGPYLVYQDRGIYYHYGVATGNKVYHVNSQNILKAAISGEVEIVESIYDSSWQIKKFIDSTFIDHYLKLAPFEKLKFSISNNCQTWAHKILNLKELEQGQAIQVAVAAMIVFYLFSNLPALLDNQSGAGGVLSSLLTKMTDLIFGTFECQVMMFVIKAVVRILCYLILYAHAPNLMTTACLVTLLIMDVNSGSGDPGLKALCSALVEGDFRGFCEMLLERAQVVDYKEAKDSIPQFTRLLDDQGAPNPKPFNEWTNAAKNVKWWISSLLDVFNWLRSFFSPKTQKVLDWVEEHDTEIATVIAAADEHILQLSTDKRYATDPKTLEVHKIIFSTLGDIYHNLSMQKGVSQFTTRVNALITKLSTYHLEVTPQWQCRPEPIGLWITGSPGCGKSFLANLVAKKVRDQQSYTVYSNPTGSEFMDGYTNQEIHIFDDFGQNREEPEFGLICNLMSSIPFVVPKAALEQKGTFYNGRLVIITTNKYDFSSCTLLDPGALERRFPYKYHIRPRPKYTVDGKFNVELAAKTGDLQSGNCWERLVTDSSGSDTWMPLNVDFLVGSIIDGLKVRLEISTLMNQGPDDDPPVLEINGKKVTDLRNVKQLDLTGFDEVDLKEVDFAPFIGQDMGDFGPFSFENPNAIVGPIPVAKIDKYKSWVARFGAKLKSFFQRHQPWIIAAGALGTLISISVSVYQLYKHLKNKEPQEEGPYTGAHKVDSPKKNYSVIAQKHLSKYIATSDQGPIDLRHICRRLVNLKTKKHLVTGLALGNKTIITYGHDPIDSILVDEGSREIPARVETVCYNNEDTDLQLVHPKNERDMRTQFKNVSSLICKQEYSGNGWLVWKFADEYIIQEVSDITFIGAAQTRSGTRSASVYLYNARTTAGTCGGLLVGLVDGTPKILGIHTSGNGVTGAANRIYPVLVDQGIVTHTETFPRPLYHQPRRSKLHPSPVYDGTSSLQPAVLSKNDPRLEVQLDDLTICVAYKYRVNQFNPPEEIFLAAKTHVASLLFSVVGVQTSLTYEQAVSNDVIPIDWSTSPGHKYPGRSKRELVALQSFKEDVMDIYHGRSDTYFTAYLKDELRPHDKIAIGATRCIEAANFDHVIAYRMVMGKIYQKIYEDRFCIAGCAVGMNVFTDFDILHQRGFDHYLCLDFKKFDGSLSDLLLRHVVDMLTACHPDHYLVERIHELTIRSTHLVSNQLWNVRGGMCSGSPCTTVVNSLANLLVCYTTMLSVGAQLDELFIVTYGDDVVISCKRQLDLQQVPLMIKIFFGMEVTAADKSDNLRWVPFMDIDFLKRKPTVFHGKIVGALSIDNMRDRIQWTRSPADFDSQLDSFLCELVLHGEMAYNQEVQRLLRIHPLLRAPPYKIMEAKMRQIVFI